MKVQTETKIERENIHGTWSRYDHQDLHGYFREAEVRSHRRRYQPPLRYLRISPRNLPSFSLLPLLLVSSRFLSSCSKFEASV